MLNRLLSLIISVGLVSAFGDVLNLSTGIDTFNTNQAVGCDAHWTVSPNMYSDLSFNTACPNDAAQVVTPSDQDWFSLVTPNTQYSSWIARNADDSHANGADDYSIHFWLDSTMGASLTGFAGAEDIGSVLLNGNMVYNGIAWQSLAPISAGSGFVAGWNSLTLRILPADDWDEGVDFQGSVTGLGASFTGPNDPPAPEPSFFVPLVLLVAGSAFLARRRALARR